MRQEVKETVLGKLKALAEQFAELERQLSDPAVVSDHQKVRSLGIKRAALEGMVGRYLRYERLGRQIAEHKQIVAEGAKGGDTELAAMAAGELPGMELEAQKILDTIADDLVTADDRAVGAVILEIRAAAGGDEAGLWAGDVFQMYQRYATRRGWKLEVMEFSAGEQGGMRQVVTTVEGPGVWQGLGYEGGVHCVKRVPATEAQGRVHTSTATVAVLPEPEELEIEIPESDVKMDITTAQGPGGQNVNKVATAVKMVHIPTGIEVRMQESKSQQQNRVKAWQLMRARVYDYYQRQKQAERRQERSAMIGSGERSERIRTYRWKENIVVDHRLNASFNLGKVLQGELEEMVSALVSQDKAQRLAAL
ncbi:MAG: PCRF domain-containing protein [Phycisphaeraceae bacterium]|nr:PCRF domain-containing protein [Phycisphaeraceae bacterium]